MVLSNVTGGALDGEYIEPHDTPEEIKVAKRAKGNSNWDWYRWSFKEKQWVFVESQKSVLRRPE